MGYLYNADKELICAVMRRGGFPTQVAAARAALERYSERRAPSQVGLDVVPSRSTATKRKR